VKRFCFVGQLDQRILPSISRLFQESLPAFRRIDAWPHWYVKWQMVHSRATIGYYDRGSCIWLDFCGSPQLFPIIRRWFRLRVLYTNTWPSNNQFWFGIFGASLLGCLGLFHFLKRVLEFLDPRCEIYWKALDAYKSTIYRYNTTDYNSLIQ
jgi:hypothetical protein